MLELFERRRANHAEIAGDQHGLDERREVHRAASRRTGTDSGVDLVDEENRPVPLRQCSDDCLEALLEVAAKARASQQGGAVERKDLGAFERRRNFGLEQSKRQTFGKRRLAYAGLAHEHGIVLPSAAEDLDGSLQLGLAADEGIEMASGRAFAEIDSVGAQRVLGGLRGLVIFVGPAPWGGLGVGRVGVRRHLGNAVRDEIQDVQARDALGGEELCRERLRLLKHRGEDVSGAHLIASRTLHVEDGRLQHRRNDRVCSGSRWRPRPHCSNDLVRYTSRSMRICRRSTPTADRIFSPSGSCASANSRCSSVRCV